MWLWWAKPSNWVPTCPISAITISSLPLRWLVPAAAAVRLTCRLKLRAADNGICALSTWPSSITSPVLMSLSALSTVAGFMWLAAPRSSPAPHFEGQRSLSAGGIQDGVCACAAMAPSISAASALPRTIRFMLSSRMEHAAAPLRTVVSSRRLS